jgi:aspartyl-tRNA(Asn)/glutamyl-tRNA(Gln) amidotransferase subunit B
VEGLTMAEKASGIIQGETGPWEMVIGMEIHAQVVSNAKLFSGASATFGAKPNENVSLVDAAMPGMLPVINGACVRQAVRTGLALGANINKHSVFDRKNYFYPDLPPGYQISQYKSPVVGEGAITIELPGGETKIIGIERLHLEQDAGKQLHDQSPKKTLLDLNRAGIALMEIVSKPDLRSAEEAGIFLRKLRSILRYIGACDGNMEEGSMRADVNVSVRKAGEKLGTRCEIKNVNSVRFVMQAIALEAKRQVGVLEGGGTIAQETRLFDPDKGETRSMRSKEEAHDYRYFPDPDLLPLEFDDAFIAECRASLPELPDAKRKRYAEALGLSPYNASVLTAEKESADFFEALLAETAQGTGRGERELATKIANWVASDLFGHLNKAGKTMAECPVLPAAGAELLALVENGTISGRTAKDVFEEMFETGKGAKAIVKAKGLEQVSDAGAIDAAVDKVLAENPDNVAAYRAGKEKVFGFFVGQVMKATGGKANPALVNEVLKKKLAG